MEVIGSLLTFCDGTFWSLVIDVYTYIYTLIKIIELCLTIYFVYIYNSIKQRGFLT